MKTLKKITLIISLSIFLTSCGSNSPIKESKVEEKPKYYAPLSGVETEKDIKNEPVFSIMLDNHPGARPQSGLNDAEIIYEFKAEGQYTRYLALFQKNQASVIGPVRSARPYFVNTASEYNSIYAHWGGSEAGYNQIQKLSLKDLDGIFLEGSTYYRNRDVKKYAPHNGYTNYELLKKSSEEKGYLENIEEFHSFYYDYSKDLESVNKQMGEINATNMSFDFFKQYNMSFEYNIETKYYKAIRNNETLIDEKDSSEVRPKNIILQFANSKVTGPNLTLTIDHIGSGSGKLFTQGKVIDINWTKDSESSKTIFTTSSGDEIILSPGLTLIEVLDENDNIKITPDIDEQIKNLEQIEKEKEIEELKIEEENSKKLNYKIKNKIDSIKNKKDA